MKARYFLLLALIPFLSGPLWADKNPFQGQQAPAPGTSVPPQLAPALPNTLMQSQAVQVYSLPDGRYHAEINYQTKADDTRQYAFEGTKTEIRQQLDQSGLPEDRKQAVMQALETNPADLFGNRLGNGFPFGNALNSLFGSKDPFDDPFFKQELFNQPFFKNSPLNDDFLGKFLQDMMQLQAPAGQPMPFPPIVPAAPQYPATQPGATGDKLWL